MFRPGAIIPFHGIVSRTTLYRVLCAAMSPLSLVWRALFPNHPTTTARLGRAMLNVARRGVAKLVLASSALQKFGQGWPTFWPRCAGGYAGAKLAFFVGAAPQTPRTLRVRPSSARQTI